MLELYLLLELLQVHKHGLERIQVRPQSNVLLFISWKVTLRLRQLLVLIGDFPEELHRFVEAELDQVVLLLLYQ